MNYGKSNLSRRKKRISSKKRMKKKRVGVRLFKAFVLCNAGLHGEESVSVPEPADQVGSVRQHHGGRHAL